MNREDLMLFGLGGGGGSVTDVLIEADARFNGYFVNSSRTDLENLINKDDEDVNYLCISNNNGAGRDKNLGRKYASKHGWSILNKIQSFNQKNIWFCSSLGGASGTGVLSVILKAIQDIKNDAENNIHFDKVINLIGILPKLDSSDEILNNTIDTWNEIHSYGVINNMIFIDNNNIVDGQYLSEEDINERFSELFDSVFEIPVLNGKNFDTRNLSRVLNSKGCTYIYDLPSGYNSVLEALEYADSTSVLAKMYKKGATINEDGQEKIICDFIGTSFNDDNYSHEEVLTRYKWKTGNFTGYNEEKNLIIMSGCLPPLYPIQVIKAELEDRKRERENQKETDFSKFVIDVDTEIERTQITTNNKNTPTQSNINKKTNTNSSSNSIKKSMKTKNLFGAK